MNLISLVINKSALMLISLRIEGWKLSKIMFIGQDGQIFDRTERVHRWNSSSIQWNPKYEEVALVHCQCGRALCLWGKFNQSNHLRRTMFKTETCSLKILTIYTFFLASKVRHDRNSWVTTNLKQVQSQWLVPLPYILHFFLFWVENVIASSNETCL